MGAEQYNNTVPSPQNNQVKHRDLCEKQFNYVNISGVSRNLKRERGLLLALTCSIAFVKSLGFRGGSVDQAMIQSYERATAIPDLARLCI